MDDARSLEILLHSLRTVLLLVSREDPNRASVVEALHFAELTRNSLLPAVERAALLRTALEHLRHANMRSDTLAADELLAATRRAMTAALFDSTSSNVPCTTGDSRSVVQMA
jgi:hypothetical protein